MDDIETLAKISKIFKSGKDFYLKAYYDNTYIVAKITLSEVKKLEVGQEIKIRWWWNESGHGSHNELIRPIQVYEYQEPKFRTVK